MHVLDHAQDHPKLGCRKIPDVFEVGKTQVACALKDKQNIRAQYETFASVGIRCSWEAKYQEINDAVSKWHRLARDAMVPVNGPMIQEGATEIATKLNIPSFKWVAWWL